MTEERLLTKDEVLQALRAGAEEALFALRRQPHEAFEQGRYENGWNRRQILAHIASIEWAYPRLIDLARSAWQGPDRDAGRSSSGATEAASMTITPARSLSAPKRHSRSCSRSSRPIGRRRSLLWRRRTRRSSRCRSVPRATRPVPWPPSCTSSPYSTSPARQRHLPLDLARSPRRLFARGRPRRRRASALPDTRPRPGRRPARA